MDEIKKELFYEQKNGYDLIGTDERIKMENYSAAYISYLNGKGL